MLVGLQRTVLAAQQKQFMRNSGDELDMDIRRLRDEKQAIQTEEASRQDLKTRIDEMIAFLKIPALRAY